MVKTGVGIAAICAVLVATAGWGEQNRVAAPLLSTDIITIIGSDADARAVVGQVLTEVARLRVSVFLASQIRHEWLPVAKGVDFVRLADTEIRGFLSGCGRYWIISNLERTRNVVKLRLSLKCGGATRDYSVSFSGSEWQLRLMGTGSGYSGFRPDCPCDGR